MNLSLSSLVLKSVFGSALFTSNNLLFKKCNFKYFASHLFYNNIRFVSFASIGSKFDGFLQNSIYINHVSYDTKQYYGSCDVNISFNIYINCQAYDRGGAVYINSPGCSVRVYCCQFFNCRTSDQGGSLFVENANIIEVYRTLFERSQAGCSGAYRFGLGPGSIFNETMKNCYEIATKVLSPDYHGNLHSTVHFEYRYNNQSYSETNSGSYGDFFFCFSFNNGIRYNNFANGKANRFICVWDNTPSAYLSEINFRNISSDIFAARSSTSTSIIDFQHCSFINNYWASICNEKIISVTTSSFSQSSTNTLQCFVFQSNSMGVSNTRAILCDSQCTSFNTMKYPPSFTRNNFLFLFLVY